MSLSEGKTVSGRFPLDWTKTFKGIKKSQRKPNCLDSDDGKICTDSIKNPEKNCFNCEVAKACKSCLDLVGQKKETLYGY